MSPNFNYGTINKVSDPRHYNPPRWCSVSPTCKRKVPSEISDWLFDAGSLTCRLQMKCPQPFRVQLTGQFYGRPCISERRALAMPAQQRALIRQVVLRCGDSPVVFARTVIPVSTLTGAQRRLAHLGERPLGAYLFSDPEMRRAPMEVAKLSEGQALYASVLNYVEELPPGIWGRRSVFYLGHKPLLVSEVFLPAIDRCQ